jgi:uncharacterized membrane protein
MLNGIIAVLAVLYPFLVYFSQGHIQPRYLAFFLAAFFLLRGARFRQGGYYWAALTSACVLFMLAATLADDADWLLAYPVFVSLVFLAVFAHSLACPPTVVERLARLQEPDLPPQGVAYTRKVTWVWCGFFIANALVSLATVWHGDPWLWSLYNGCVAYVLMGLLMAGEILVRRKIKQTFAVGRNTSR